LIRVIDCTFRDGGYYNNWKFNYSLVEQYIEAIIESKVDIVEIGFRFLPTNRDLGDLAFSTDKYLNQLTLLGDIDVAVMINAKEFIESNLGIDIALNSVFGNKSDSMVDIVRIATHFNDINECQLIANILSKLGYRVFLNLMQIDSLKSSILSDAVNQINKWNCIEVFYFADSFGNLNTHSIDNIIETIKPVWDGEIGIHAHDNKGHALVNSLSAIDSGVCYVDATILGMGRGAGNTKMENLLVEITDKNLGNYEPDEIFHLALKEFSLLQEQYKWGSSIYYYLSAVHGIHPTYIQEMLGDGRYNIDQILSAITFLKDKVSSSYSLENMMDALSNSIGSECGSWSAKDWAKDKEVLIVGSGPSVGKYINEIEQYIETNNPIVLCLNINQDFPESLVDAYITCHETRIAIELDLYTDLTKPIILPMSRIPRKISGILSNVEIFDYGLKIEKGSFSVQDNGCILDKPLVLIYALSLLSVSDAEKISLTGVDGYEDQSPKQKELNNAFVQFQENNRGINLMAITPTNLPINTAFICD
jgi:4-hydroxy 2-oxovalerate aldolase